MFCALGRFAYSRRKLIVLAWLVVVALGLPLIPGLPRLLKPGGFSDPTLEAQRAADVMARELGDRGASLVVVFPVAGTPFQNADDPAFLDAADAALAPLAQLPVVDRVIGPRTSARQIAPDEQAAIAVVVLKGDADAAVRRVAEVEAALAPGPLHPIVTGGPVAYADIVRVSEQDLRRAELISIPLALVALVVVFGSIVAASMPVVVGGLSVLVALALLSLVARATDLSVFVLNLASMLGLGLGTDYSLFITSRFREELRASGDVATAVERAVAHAGRAVFFSGLTVFVGLSGLVTFNFMMLRSLGLGGAIVVALGVLAALTLLPALLATVGHRIDALALLRWSEAQAPLWTRLAAAVMSRPWRVLVPVLVLLLAMGTPFLGARFSLPDVAVLPESVESRVGYDLIQRHWGQGETGPITLVLQAPSGSILSPERVAALYDLSRYVAQDPEVARVESIVDVDPRITKGQYELLYAHGRAGLDAYTRASLGAASGEHVTSMTVVPKCSSTADECVDLVHRLRALKPGADLTMLVGGAPPAIADIVDRLYGFFPYAAGLVVLTTYVILFTLFRSVLLPLKAILMNGLSLVASYGALVVVFQEGYGARLLGFRPLGYVEATLPIIMFCLLFGLSMDYEVFLLTRVKEAWDAGASNAESVARGLTTSGRVITNAALIVVLVSLSFVSADVILVKAVGLGTALAVLLDATVVRALLVPATMRLLGDLNWWAPRFFRRSRPRTAYAG